ncbi:MAG: hypothetical protein WDO56_24030 [Gammaproteobacteria bacterium]
MSSDPTHPTSAGTAERRPAVWPWLLLPLVALALFFALRSVKQGRPGHSSHPDAAAEVASGEAAESR